MRGTFETVKLPVSELMLGRIFDGKGESKDGKLEMFSNRRMDINGSVLNPYYREVPSKLVRRDGHIIHRPAQQHRGRAEAGALLTPSALPSLK